MSPRTKKLVACLIIRSVLNDVAGYQMLKRVRALRDENAKYQADLRYVCEIFHREGIELNEFDLIALNYVRELP